LTSTDPARQARQEDEVQAAHEAYLAKAAAIWVRVMATVAPLKGGLAELEEVDLAEIERFVGHARRQLDQVRRRVILGETIPHEEKVFSLFEPHTEWISKGKAGVTLELGWRVAVLEDQFGFILHPRVMVRETDD
jgi:IS5 family transposase